MKRRLTIRTSSGPPPVIDLEDGPGEPAPKQARSDAAEEQAERQRLRDDQAERHRLREEQLEKQRLREEQVARQRLLEEQSERARLREEQTERQRMPVERQRLRGEEQPERPRLSVRQSGVERRPSVQIELSGNSEPAPQAPSKRPSHAPAQAQAPVLGSPAGVLPTGLPMTCGGGGCPAQGDPQAAAAAVQRQGDLRKVRMHPDHASRPLWVCPDGRIYFEAFHPQGPETVDFLIAVAEPVSRPEAMQEFQMTMLSLNAAVSAGIDVETIVKLLDRLSKNALDDGFVRFIRETGRSIGKTKLVLRENRYFLETLDRTLMSKLVADLDIAESLVRPGAGANTNHSLHGDPAGGGEAVASIEVNPLRVEVVKAAAHKLQLPLLQEYEYKRDRSEGNPQLHAVLRPTADLRPYQQRALSKIFAMDGVAKSGLVVLPCGAGKTLLGIAAACRVGRRTLVLTTTAVAVDQWRRQFLMWTTIPPEDIYTLTADEKIPIADPEQRACVLISTYSMLGFSGKRSGDAELVLSQIQQLEWGMLVVDEVQVMPARTFRSVATTVKTHCALGLTATLVREDNLIYDLHWLIGPKLYEASWQQLQEDGYIARVRCVEVWCEMSKAFFAEYLQAQDSKHENLRRALWTCNPNKLKVCEYLIRYHETRGDKVIVFSDNIFILEEFAKRLGRYYICGKVDMRERMQILTAFKETSACNTIFLSKVGDNAIDIPSASVIIQISSHYGSRRQEAQRLGRILRPKPKAFNSNTKFSAFFYSLVSRDTQEMFYANKRQSFLVEQGYNYHVLRDESVHRMDSKDLVYWSESAQLQLLKQVLDSVQRGEGGETEGEDVALHGKVATASTAAAKTKAEELGSNSNVRTSVDERVNFASLSGGLDGSYAVLSTATPRQVKPPDLA